MPDEQTPQPDTEVEETPEETPEEEPETFDRPYVERLRTEAADRRAEAREAREALTPLRDALWAAQVAATGRLADPSDLALPDDGDPLDQEAITAAVDDLIERKPHLASRRPRGEVGQGENGAGSSVDLAGMLRSRA